MISLLAAVVYGSMVGFSLGLTGSGGSILAIPLLVYGLGIPIEQAIVASLMMVAAIALIGAARQSLMKNTNWRAAILFSLAGMIVSPLVVQAAREMDETLRLALFAGLMLVVALRMGLSPPSVKNDAAFEALAEQTPAQLFAGAVKIFAGGAAAGALSGFFGVGGGFVIVPLLVSIFHMPYRVAVGTSLASIFLISMAAVAGALVNGDAFDWSVFTLFVGGGAGGMLAGSALINAIPEHIARIIFALLTTSLGIFILIDRLYLQQGGL